MRVWIVVICFLLGRSWVFVQIICKVNRFFLKWQLTSDVHLSFGKFSNRRGSLGKLGCTVGLVMVGCNSLSARLMS